MNCKRLKKVVTLAASSQGSARKVLPSGTSQRLLAQDVKDAIWGQLIKRPEKQGVLISC